MVKSISMSYLIEIVKQIIKMCHVENVNHSENER